MNLTHAVFGSAGAQVSSCSTGQAMKVMGSGELRKTSWDRVAPGQ